MSSHHEQESTGRRLREHIAAGDRAEKLGHILLREADDQLRIPGGICTYEPDGQGGWRRYLARSATRSQVNLAAEVSTPQLCCAVALADISIGGCAILTTDLRTEDLRAGLLTVSLPGGGVCQLTFTVRWQITTGDSELMMGLQVAPVASQDGAAWFELVTPALFPQTRAVTVDSLAGLWAVLSERYFPISHNNLLAFRPTFERANLALARHPLLGHAILWPGEGTISFLGAYTHSFVGHQIARVSAETSRIPARQVLRELYLHSFERTLIHPGLRWISGLVARDSPWMRVHSQYAEALGVGAFVSPLRLLEIHCTPLVPLPEDVDVSAFTDDAPDARALLMAAGRRGHPYADSLDLTADNLGLDRVRRRFQMAGLARDRQLLAARIDGRLAALAVLDAVEPGVNLFFIHDAVRIFRADPGIDTATWDRAVHALLAHAQRWFGGPEKDRARFSFISEEDGAEAISPGVRFLPFSDTGAGDYWVLSASRVPDFLEHICEQTATPLESPP